MAVRPALLRPGLVRLLALLLLLQWGSAFAHCLRLAAPAEGLTVEICTSEGIHRVVMPAEDGDGHGEDGHLAVPPCPACLGPGALALPAPEVALAPPVLLVQAADPPPPPPAPAPQPPRSCQPRAPPTS